jgi:predicted permease
VRLLRDDLRYAWRQLRRTPAFTFVAVLTLALGIGATTAFYGAVSALFLQPPPERPAGLYSVASQYPGEPRVERGMQRVDFRALEAHLPASVLAVTAIDGGPCLIQRPGLAEYVTCENVTTGFAGAFDARAVAGRWFQPEDDRPLGGDAVVISERLWRKWFGADPAVIGQASIRAMGARRRIIGVASAGFSGYLEGTDVWLLQPSAPGAVRPPDWWKRSRWPGVTTFVRARPGTTPDEVRAQLAATVSAASAGPDSSHTSFSVFPIRERAAPPLGYWILAFAALVFLAACANLANMLYARNSQRAAEIAVRLSLGASRPRIVRMFVAEAAILSGLAAASGLAIAIGLSRWFSEVFPTLRLSAYDLVGVETTYAPDARVFLCALGLGAAATLFIGLTSAWRATRSSSLRPITASAPAGMVPAPARGLQTTLVSIQITAAVLLVLAATMFLENTRKAYDQRVTYETAPLTGGHIRLPGQELDSTGRVVPMYTESRGRHFFDRLIGDAGAMPGVERAALVSALPGGTNPSPQWLRGCFRAEDPPEGAAGNPRRIDGARVVVSSGALGTIGVRILAGRDVFATDTADTPPVAIVTESVAMALWPDMSPVGRKMHDCNSRQWLTVVGVASNVLKTRSQPVNHVFVPFTQAYQPSMLLLTRSDNPRGQVDSIRALVSRMDSEVAVFEVAPADELLLRGVSLQRATRTLALSLGGLSLAIAVLGVYGVVAYFVSRRTREFGLRLALGATRAQVLKLVIDRAIHVVLVGLVPAVLVASLGYRYLTNMVQRFLPGELAPWILVPILMLVAGVIAAYVPARRASRVDPNVALRAD